ncbi:hypothetical protein BHM03_00051423 [Ensete ventricosum]|nr:hypothetical protein BHM03_00051423 [Ensete ventricosum]
MVVCRASFRNLAVPASSLIYISSSRRLFRSWGSDLSLKPAFCHWNNRKFRASVKMMFDSSASVGPQAIVNVLQEKDRSGDGDYMSGGWKRCFVMLEMFPNPVAVCYGAPDIVVGETYLKTDSDFLEAERIAFRDDGSTASTAILIGNQLYVANVGDSRVVMSKAGEVITKLSFLFILEAIALSDDHKPNRSDERNRIENAGGFVMWAGKSLFEKYR